MSLSKKNIGATLIETIIVVLIISILALLAVPSFLIYLESTRLKSAGESLGNNLNLARSEAFKQNINIRVVFQTGSNWCYGITTTSTCNCSIAGNCNLGQTDSSSAANTSLSLSGISTDTTFSSLHGTATPSGSITFTSSSKSITVELNSQGFTKICSSTVSGYSAC